MSLFLSPGWLSYLFTGALAVMASWAFSGCRFGNRTSDHPQQYDPVSGYYEMQAQSLIYCASAPGDKCANAATNLIPQDYTEILTNPVALQVTNPDEGRAIMFSPFGGEYGIPIFVNPDQSLSILRTSAVSTLWEDAACTRQDQELIEGAYSKTNGPWTSNTPGIPKSGRIGLVITFVSSFSGNCAASMAAIAACYNDSSQCGSHSADDVRALFAPYINSGAITAADIPQISNLAYEISYE